jgi:hypothetical protein
MLEPRSLPRWIVMVDEGGSPSQDFGHDGRSWQVHGDRQEILDDHEIGVVNRCLHVAEHGGSGSTDLQTGHNSVDRAFAGNRDNIPTVLGQNSLPQPGYDRNAVTAAQAEREHRGSSHVASV